MPEIGQTLIESEPAAGQPVIGSLVQIEKNFPLIKEPILRRASTRATSLVDRTPPKKRSREEQSCLKKRKRSIEEVSSMEMDDDGQDGRTSKRVKQNLEVGSVGEEAAGPSSVGQIFAGDASFYDQRAIYDKMDEAEKEAVNLLVDLQIKKSSYSSFFVEVELISALVKKQTLKLENKHLKNKEKVCEKTQIFEKILENINLLSNAPDNFLDISNLGLVLSKIVIFAVGGIIYIILYS